MRSFAPAKTWMLLTFPHDERVILPVTSIWIKSMMTNKEPQTGTVSIDTRVESGKDEKQFSNEVANPDRRFGVMDLWKIRSNARTFRIHNRLSRL
ncbi:MAG: hypothetical protein EOO14_02890 [Chitinophagaceae bacterium]|nr:MAG: hypothetical protein EOO14_02890 [Chitinophagaceae bacterium]